LVNTHGSSTRYRRVDSLTPCPCRTPEGFRDPEWHLLNPLEPLCDENGMLPDPDATVDITVKAFVQPVQARGVTRLTIEYIEQMFGTVQADDHLGIFPCSWSGFDLNFYNWSQSGEDFVEYNSRRFNVVNANLIPDPADGNPYHHWEIGLRLMNSTPIT
jgi:hypothetical protein